MRDVQQEDLLLSRGANPRTGMISPDKLSIDGQMEQNNTGPTRGRCASKWQQRGDQWVSTKDSNTLYGPRHQVPPARNRQRTALRVPQKLGNPNMRTSSNLIQSHSMYTLNDQAPYLKSRYHPTPKESVHPTRVPLYEHEDHIHINDAKVKRRPVGSPDGTMLALEYDLESLKPRPLAINSERYGSNLRSSSAPTPRKHQDNRYEFVKDLPRLPIIADKSTLMNHVDKVMATETSKRSVQDSRSHCKSDLIKAKKPQFLIRDKALPDLPIAHHYPKAESVARPSTTTPAPVSFQSNTGKTNQRSPCESQVSTRACLNPSLAFVSSANGHLKVSAPVITGGGTMELAGIPNYDNPPEFPTRLYAAQSYGTSDLPQTQACNGAKGGDVSKLTTYPPTSPISYNGAAAARSAQDFAAPQLSQQIPSQRYRYHVGADPSPSNRGTVIQGTVAQSNNDGTRIDELNLPNAGVERNCNRRRGGLIPEMHTTIIDDSSHTNSTPSPSTVNAFKGNLATSTAVYSTDAAFTYSPQKDGAILLDSCSSNDKSLEHHGTKFGAARHIPPNTMPYRRLDEPNLFEEQIHDFLKTGHINHIGCCLECCENGCHGGCVGHPSSEESSEMASADNLIASGKNDIAAMYHDPGIIDDTGAANLSANRPTRQPSNLLVKGRNAPLPKSKFGIHPDERGCVGKLSTHVSNRAYVLGDARNQVSIGALSAAKKAIELDPSLRSHSSKKTNEIDVKKTRPNSSSSRSALACTSTRTAPKSGTLPTPPNIGSSSHNTDQSLSARKITPLTGWTTVTSKRQNGSATSIQNVGLPTTHGLGMVQVWEMIMIPVAVGRMWLRKNPQVFAATGVVVHHYGKMIIDLHSSSQIILHMVYIYSKTGEVMLPKDMTVPELLRDCLKCALYSMVLAATFTVVIRIIKFVMFPLTVILWIVRLMTAGKGLSIRNLA